ncbi:MAG: hotdog fold thioesterase, partial [Acetobacteraceae bacterium]
MTTDPEALARTCAEIMWQDDQAAQQLGIALKEVAPGRAVLGMTIAARMVNGHGSCHGGYIFALADTAFAYA